MTCDRDAPRRYRSTERSCVDIGPPSEAALHRCEERVVRGCHRAVHGSYRVPGDPVPPTEPRTCAACGARSLPGRRSPGRLQSGSTRRPACVSSTASHRRHRWHRVAARRPSCCRRPSAAWRHREGGTRFPGCRTRSGRYAGARRDTRAVGGRRPDRMHVPRRPAPDELRPPRMEPAR
jgi:hypothetical protein